MNIRLKRGLLPNLLTKKRISFNNCGISQQSFENIRDGLFVSDKTISNLEDKCGLFRGIHFPIDAINDKVNIDTKFVDFGGEWDLKDQDLAKAPEINDPAILDSIMHKFNYDFYRVIESSFKGEDIGFFENIYWAVDVPKDELADDYFLKKIPTTGYESRNNDKINDYKSIKDLDPDFISLYDNSKGIQELISSRITLNTLIEKFNYALKNPPDRYHEYLDNKNKKLSSGSDGILEAVEATKKGKCANVNQMEFILDFFEVNGYEFRYCTQMELEENLIEKNKRNYLLRADIEEALDHIAGCEFPYYDDKTYEGSVTEYIESDLAGNHGNIVERLEGYSDLQYSKNFTPKYFIYMFLTKKNDNTRYIATTDKNLCTSKDFHSLSYMWAKNDSALSIMSDRKSDFPYSARTNDKVVPTFIPLFSKNDKDFFKKINSSLKFENYLEIDGRVSKDQEGHNEELIREIFPEKKSVRDYCLHIHSTFVKSQYSYNKNELVSITLPFEYRRAHFESFLAFVIDFYSFSFDKFKSHEDFLRCLNSDIKEYLYDYYSSK